MRQFIAASCSSSVVGFQLQGGKLHRIPGSLRLLTENGANSASVAFSPDRHFLAVTAPFFPVSGQVVDVSVGARCCREADPKARIQRLQLRGYRRRAAHHEGHVALSLCDEGAARRPDHRPLPRAVHGSTHGDGQRNAVAPGAARGLYRALWRYASRSADVLVRHARRRI